MLFRVLRSQTKSLMSDLERLIVITGAFRFPEGDAAAARVLGLGKALRKNNYEVQFAGWEEGGRLGDKGNEGGFVYQGFRYFPQNQFRTQPLNPIFRLAKYLLMGVGVVRWLWRYSRERNIHAIISYHGGVIYLLLLRLFCWHKKVKLAIDCTEWYEASSLPGGRWGVAAIDSELRMRFVNPWIGQVIAISRYLDEYYKARNCRVIRLPPMVDLGDRKWMAEKTTAPQGLRLAYAGVPGKKDVLYSVMLCLDVLRAEGHLVSLDLIGPSEAEIFACVDGDDDLIDRLRKCLIFHGRIPQSQVPSILKQADFSILFRPQRRSSDAGFSTKLVESLAVGVPVIANPTGDIGAYVRDGREGIIVADERFDPVLAGLRRAIALTPGQLADMSNAAEECARHNFHYEVHCADLKKFMESCE